MADTNSVDYWKNEALSWKSKCEEAQQELEEFSSSSRELEQELEKELKQAEQSNAILRSDLSRLRDESRSAKELEQRNTRRIEALEEQVKNYEAQKSSMTQYRRELEQKNDELETNYRNLTASLEDHARKIEALIEEKALLENELEQSRGQKLAEQRLRDELKDLRDEMTARNRSDEARQAAQRERRRTVDQNFQQSDNEISRLQAIASGGDVSPLVNGHDNSDFLHKACKEREAELTSALRTQCESKSIVQNLIRKLTFLETRTSAVQKSPAARPNNATPK
ncbi:nuclear distribution protein nudE-like 1-B [Paramacrobiotus metropolitanus]|uniref:nuclear distribution protein nudE-like 1-B n=1 Tax=Paramacrobiotus metropolitanus TaxID=2943436 RepID=UPI00244579E3|nr:nuclear distribution protein nudE-like 1-B [Paramacrobiotus metropolitanus]